MVRWAARGRAALGGGAAHGGGEGGEKQRPAISGITGRHWFRLAGGEGLTPLVLLRAASASGWAVTSSGLHQREARPAARVTATALRSDRTHGPSHCTPRRQIGVDEERDWPRRPGHGDHLDRRTSPMTVNVLPRIRIRTGPTGRLPGSERPALLLRDQPNIRSLPKRRKCRCLFGLRALMWIKC